MFYLTVQKLKLDYLPAGNSIDICPTFERKRQGQTFNYCSFREGFAVNAASGMSSPFVNICTFSTITQLLICLHCVFIQAMLVMEEPAEEFVGDHFPCRSCFPKRETGQRGCLSSQPGHETPPGCCRAAWGSSARIRPPGAS